jgi:4-amino-4-deoxy-L-arabinose transferase-like glycosyltransferase
MNKLARIVLVLAAVKLALHLYAGRHYGYFVDELYYLACSQHLAWGYVDQAPLIAAIAKTARVLFGDSLSAIRFFPALAGAGQVLLAGMIARELGGRAFAQGLAALCTLLAPGFLALDNLLTMNAFEPLFWMGCAYLAIRIIRTGDEQLWLWFGAVAGAGLMNKHSMLIFGFGVVAGLLLTPQRKHLWSRWFWAEARLRSRSSCPTWFGTSSTISRFSNCRRTSGATPATCRSRSPDSGAKRL